MVEMFDHAYQNYMVSEAFADFTVKVWYVFVSFLKMYLLLNL